MLRSMLTDPAKIRALRIILAALGAAMVGVMALVVAQVVMELLWWELPFETFLIFLAIGLGPALVVAAAWSWRWAVWRADGLRVWRIVVAVLLTATVVPAISFFVLIAPNLGGITFDAEAAGGLLKYFAGGLPVAVFWLALEAWPKLERSGSSGAVGRAVK